MDMAIHIVMDTVMVMEDTVIHTTAIIIAGTVLTLTAHIILDIMDMATMIMDMVMELTITADTTGPTTAKDFMKDPGLQITADTITAVCQAGLHMDTAIQESIPLLGAEKLMRWELTIVTEAGNS